MYYQQTGYSRTTLKQSEKKTPPIPRRISGAYTDLLFLSCLPGTAVFYSSLIPYGHAHAKDPASYHTVSANASHMKL